MLLPLGRRSISLHRHTSRHVVDLNSALPASAAVGAAEAERRLSARTREDTPKSLLSSQELAARAELKTRQSVHDWRRKDRIVR